LRKGLCDPSTPAKGSVLPAGRIVSGSCTLAG
jgi:hypothetical protein